MFAKFFRTARIATATARVIVKGTVCRLDGQFVIVMSEENGTATVRYENDTTNSVYTVLTAWLN